MSADLVAQLEAELRYYDAVLNADDEMYRQLAQVCATVAREFLASPSSRAGAETETP